MTITKLTEIICDSIAQSQAMTAHLPKPIAGVTVHRNGRAIEICLDTSRPSYSKWLEGEGADIGLLFDTETNKILGVRLALYAKTLIFCDDRMTLTIDLTAEAEREGT